MKGSFRKRGCKCPKGKGKKCTCGSTWSFRIDIGKDPKTGTRLQPEFTGYATRAVAEDACADMITKYSKGELSADAGNETVESFMRKYLETVLKNEVEGNTYEQKVAQMENHIIPALGRIKIQKLTPMQVQGFINELPNNGLGAGTIQNIMRLMNQTLNKAVEWGYVTKNVATLTSKPSYKPEKHEVWNKEQFTQFLKSTHNTRFYPFYLIALTGGMRPGEITALSRDKLDFKQNTITVDCTVALTKEKGIHIKPSPKNDSSRRVITMPATTMSFLKRYVLKLPSNEFNLIIHGIKGPICYESVVRQVMWKDCKAAGVPYITPHGLRHTFATYLLSPPPFGLGQNVTAVAEILGHAKPTTTWNTYSHTLPKMQESIADMFDQSLDFIG